MAMSFLPMILMFLGTTGGMNELLDLTDPRSYLEAQGVEYRVEAMLTKHPDVYQAAVIGRQVPGNEDKTIV